MITRLLLALSLGWASWIMAAPNVLFIAIDDLNDWISPLNGHPMVQTPHMERLARRGTTFLNAHCQAPLCNPSRTSVLTGLRPSTTGVYALDTWFRSNPALSNLTTLPQAFMHQGYNVLTGGKIYHDAYPPPRSRTNNVEFSVWGPHGGAGKHKPAKKLVNTPAKLALMDWGVFPQRDEDCFDHDIATWAVDQLKALPAEKPFMLCVGFRHPHVPCYAPQKWFDLYPDTDAVLPKILRDDRADIPRFAWYLHWDLPEPRLKWLEEAGQWRNLVRSYLASVSFVDAQVGRVLDALDAHAAASNTVVVLWSDQGWHLGEKDITGKNTLWDRSTRSPLIFAGPGVAKNARCAQPVELLDLYPTLLDLCQVASASTFEIKAGTRLEGHSLVPQLRNANAKRDWPAITTQGPNNHSVRTERWRYIRYADGSEELYDMAADPNEWTNLAQRSEHGPKKAELAQWLPKVNEKPLGNGVTRLVEVKDGVVYWEGKPIQQGEKIPGME